MKKIIDRAGDAAKRVAEGLRKTLDPSLDVGLGAKPLEIRNSIVEHIELRAEAAGIGKRILPGRWIRVTVWSSSGQQQSVLTAALDDLETRVIARLREIGCKTQPGFLIEVVHVRRRPRAWTPDQVFSLDFRLEMAPERPSKAPTEQQELRFTVLRGTAKKASFRFREPVIRVGRGESPKDSVGRTRTNHLAFDDDNSEHNQSVGRGHCEIRFSKETGYYRVFDQGSTNGTRIVRRGETLIVPPHDPVGTVLKAGDELQFGTAAVRVHFEK